MNIWLPLINFLIFSICLAYLWQKFFTSLLQKKNDELQKELHRVSQLQQSAEKDLQLAQAEKKQLAEKFQQIQDENTSTLNKIKLSLQELHQQKVSELERKYQRQLDTARRIAQKEAKAELLDLAFSKMHQGKNMMSYFDQAAAKIAVEEFKR